MLTVIRLLPVLDYGGVETCTVAQSQLMKREGLELRICTFWKEGDAAEKIRDAGVAVDCLGVDPAIRNPRATVALYRYLRQQSPDILHASITEANLHGVMAGKMAQVPCIITEEVGEPRQRSWKAHGMVGATMHLADHCIGVSKPVAQYLTGRLHLPEHKVTHLDNGVTAWDVPSEATGRSARRDFGIPEGAPVIGSVGRLDDEIKRFSDLIDAVAELEYMEQPPWLVIAGDGPDREALEAAARRAELGERVVFTGFQSDIRRIYAMMDIFALLSQHEAFGLVVVEAMFSELPVVVTDTGGMSGIVVDGMTGFKIPRFSPVKAARKLRTLVESPETRGRFGRAGRTRGIEYYSSERYSRELCDLYFDLGATFCQRSRK